MEGYKGIKINNLLDYDLSNMVAESKEEGFRFVERLANDYKRGTNTFNKEGEALCGILNEKGALIAVARLNIDPFNQNNEIGRIRRFYVSKNDRRKGIGSLLLKHVILEAENFFKILVLRTNSEEADQFYCAYGFSKVNTFSESSHSLKLG